MSGFLPGPYGPLVYRSISEWQQLALSGQLRPEHQLYDPVRGVWVRAGEHPELRPYFPAPPVNWAALLGFGTLAALAVAALGSTATESRGSDITLRPERRTGKKRVFVGFDFDNDKVLKGFVIGQARNPDSPFEVTDTSLKEAAPMKTWEDKARVAIGRSALVLVMVGRYTYRAPGVLKEVRMARDDRADDRIPGWDLYPGPRRRAALSVGLGEPKEAALVTVTSDDYSLLEHLKLVQGVIGRVGVGGAAW